MPTDEAIKLWISSIERRCSRNTYELYKRVVWEFFQYAPANCEDLKLEHLEKYLAARQNVKPATINCDIVVLKSFGRWLEDHDLPNPAKKLRKLPQSTIPARCLSEQEYTAVLAVCRPNEKPIIEFLGNTGLRAREFLSLTHTSINGNFANVVGKAGKLRLVPLNSTARQAIETHLNFSKKLTYKQLHYLCQCLSRRVGIKHFSPHSLRHYFATQMMRKGVSIYRISKILGNSPEITEKIYVHFLAQIDLDGATDVLD